MEREKYINLFVDESRENLLALNDYLLELEKGSGDLPILNDIFRVAHTLKGMAATLGFKEITELTHEMESLLDLLRNAQLPVTSEIMDILFLCLDSLENLIENVVLPNPPAIDISLLMLNLRKQVKLGTGSGEPVAAEKTELLQPGPGSMATLYSPEEKRDIIVSIKNGYLASEIEIIIMKDSLMKAIRVLLILQALENKGKVIKTTPSREELNAENFDRSFVVTLIHSVPVDQIKDTVLSIAEVTRVYVEDLSYKFKDELEKEIFSDQSKQENNGSFRLPAYTDTEKNVLTEAVKQGFKCFEIYVSLMKDTVMKAIRVQLVLNVLQKMECQVIRSTPSGQRLLEGDLDDHFILTVISASDEETLKNEILSIAEISQVEILPIVGSYFERKAAKPFNNLMAEIPDLSDYEKLLINEVGNASKRAVLLGVHLMPGTIMKYARFVLVTKKLENLGEIIKTIPEHEELEHENFEDYFKIIFLTEHRDDIIINTVSSVAEVTDIVDLKPLFEKEVPEHSLITEKLPEVSETPTVKKAAEQQKNDINPIQKSSEISKTETVELKARKNITKKQTIRVDTDRLDQLINLVEELVIIKSRLAQISAELNSQELVQTSRTLTMLSGNLQNAAMSLRMVPVEHIFNRFPRMIRDISKSLDKEINFFMEGEDTELDRTVVDEIGDPLVHLLRNCADHGIEKVEERVKAGKDKTGNIKLIARHEGNNVLIIVEDDGGGINTGRVKEKALKKGLISKEHFENMSIDEELNLIFLPGLSTADATTDLSGRGVGMDAVLTKIKSIGGDITIFSEAGTGTRFTVKLPLTLAIMDVLLVGVGNDTFAIPITYIQEVRELFPEEIKSINNKVNVTVLRDKTIPLIYLSEKLAIPVTEKKHTELLDGMFEETVPVVIVRSEEGKKTNALVVDSIIGQEDVVIKSLGKIARDRYNYISGTANLGNGKLALILNVSEIT